MEALKAKCQRTTEKMLVDKNKPFIPITWEIVKEKEIISLQTSKNEA